MIVSPLALALCYNITLMNDIDIEKLNRTYGAPGRIVFKDGFAGCPNVVLANKYGTAEVALFGACVLSYRPTGHSNVIFRPAKKDAEYQPGESFHGGIPVCWPQFGNRFDKGLPQHGFARKSLFKFRSTEYTEEKTEVVLSLTSDAKTLEAWPHVFDLEVVVSVTMKLNVTVRVKNTGESPFAFSCGLHPYFLLRERDRVTVRGLDKLGYIDASGDTLVEGVQEGDVALTKDYDHVFNLPQGAVKSEFAILDSGLGRAIAIAATGNTKAVVWNPGTAYVVGDHTAEDWRRFVCVEPVSDWPGGRTLEAGAEYVLALAVQCHLEEKKGS